VQTLSLPTRQIKRMPPIPVDILGGVSPIPLDVVPASAAAAPTDTAPSTTTTSNNQITTDGSPIIRQWWIFPKIKYDERIISKKKSEAEPYLVVALMAFMFLALIFVVFRDVWAKKRGKNTHHRLSPNSKNTRGNRKNDRRGSYGGASGISGGHSNRVGSRDGVGSRGGDRVLPPVTGGKISGVEGEDDGFGFRYTPVPRSGSGSGSGSGSHDAGAAAHHHSRENGNNNGNNNSNNDDNYTEKEKAKEKEKTHGGYMDRIHEEGKNEEDNRNGDNGHDKSSPITGITSSSNDTDGNHVSGPSSHSTGHNNINNKGTGKGKDKEESSTKRMISDSSTSDAPRLSSFDFSTPSTTIPDAGPRSSLISSSSPSSVYDNTAATTATTATMKREPLSSLRGQDGGDRGGWERDKSVSFLLPAGT